MYVCIYIICIHSVPYMSYLLIYMDIYLSIYLRAYFPILGKSQQII